MVVGKGSHSLHETINQSRKGTKLCHSLVDGCRKIHSTEPRPVVKIWTIAVQKIKSLKKQGLLYQIIHIAFEPSSSESYSSSAVMLM